VNRNAFLTCFDVSFTLRSTRCTIVSRDDRSCAPVADDVAAFDVSGESDEPPNNKEPDVVITGSGASPRAAGEPYIESWCPTRLMRSVIAGR
jgi:hypothetical protein